MQSPTIETIVKMMETLSEATRAKVVEHLREYIEDIEDEARWDRAFQSTQPQLVAAARRAKQEIAEGKAKPLDIE